MNRMQLASTATVLSLALTARAEAREIVSKPVHTPQSIYCATREAGNPHSKYCDYIMWSKWRQRGGWDSSLDNACLRDPHYIPAECGLDPRSQSYLQPR
jgi:hypothetical protein